MLLSNKINPTILAIITTIGLSACSTTHVTNMPIIDPLLGISKQHVGYAAHDPCIRCGEGWIFIPNSAQDSKTAHQKWLDIMADRGFDVTGDTK
tara:strand:- start:21 stop:302 length:282 start_codon:yes stop_codon:yes gene_type:complete